MIECVGMCPVFRPTAAELEPFLYGGVSIVLASIAFTLLRETVGHYRL